MIYITALLQVGRSQQVAERRLQELQVLKMEVCLGCCVGVFCTFCTWTHRSKKKIQMQRAAEEQGRVKLEEIAQGLEAKMRGYRFLTKITM